MSTPTQSPAHAGGFDQFALPPTILKALKAMQFNTPTEIQAKAIPVALTGKDVMGMAQTGTGKTAAFMLPIVSRLLTQPGEGALVLTPTRELAAQIEDFLKKLIQHEVQLSCALLIGGTSMKAQLRAIASNPRILIATPGRLVDHLRTKNARMLMMKSILVLDEADRMLDMGFLPQLKTILQGLPAKRQTMMFSATFEPQVKQLANQYLRSPVEVSAGTAAKPIEKIQHDVIHTDQKQKNNVLTDELNARKGSVLIFTRTKHRADRLSRFLRDSGYSSNRIHGDRSQSQRQQALEGFRSQEFRILVATDIASRGIDIDHIEHVINYDLPQTPEDYVHRIGRTARNGRAGKALCLLTPEDGEMWNMIVRLTKGAVGEAMPRGKGGGGGQQQARGGGGGQQRARSGGGGGANKGSFSRGPRRKFRGGGRGGQQQAKRW